MTTRDACVLRPGLLRHRASDEVDPRLLPRHRRAAMGVVDRRADGARADRARAADGQADPLDAVPAAACAGDEGAAAALQGRPRKAERRADEVLQGEPHQPGCVVPAARRAVPGLHRALPDAEALLAPHHRLVAARRPRHLREDDLALVGLHPARRLRGITDRVDLLHGNDDGQDPAQHHDGAAARVHHGRLALPGRPRSLLDDDQPLDRRAGPRDAAPRPEDEAGRSCSAAGRPEAFLADPAARRRRRQRDGRGGDDRAGEAEAHGTTPPREAQEGRRAPVSDEVSVEATGETVGEAKWKALRDLERAAPGLDKTSVAFQVVSEGERGLLGVGYTPARVIASVDAVAAPPPRPPRDDETAIEQRVRALVERVVGAMGVGAQVDVRETDDEVLVTCTGGDLGLLIGKHGQTIDALQHVANAALHRGGGDAKPVTVDAAGYRDRRRSTLEGIALRGAERAARGERVLLEPMTAGRAQGRARAAEGGRGRADRERGREPNRYVVVLPA